MGDGVLRRLLLARHRAEAGAGRAPQLPQPVPATPARAAATAVGRAADRLYRLGVQPVEVAPGALTLPELPELLPQPALLVVLQGPGDLVGMAALCPETVTALIEIQALGRVTARPAERRRLTRSDAMICADFVNALMAELATEMAGVEGFDAISGYRYATWLDDPRPLALMLEDKPFRSIDFHLRLGGSETRDSRIFIALPQPAAQDRAAPRAQLSPPVRAAEAPGPDAATPSAPSGGNTPVTSAALAGVVQAAPVELVGVLCRRRISLGELRALAAGKLLHLPRASLTEARLETADGQLLALGKFGEADGCHAIRLRDPDAALQPAGAGVSPRADGHAAKGVPDRPPAEPPIEDLAQPDAFRHDGRAAAPITGQPLAGAPERAPKAAGIG
ncbi:flagellar motor switch protein FliM [Paracoccus spongiarum]|uniref:FliM/FliN family flagellar motor C-terminal domain-containing protein n=1 Tax=Paracoccus spongiarum TaxID=3064387 RepID=A0ABT9JGC5_9RHOB|nr:FliM/FliN family flagellar motor C-terminal domain-containing protein [Paracoccus sp. 2205BS29-5]MDP5308888.1 FliM/FliN family flagellar motor C-terminal domain-containing protein [Paracoccus sp. 2205BS29-5]